MIVELANFLTHQKFVKIVIILVWHVLDLYQTNVLHVEVLHIWIKIHNVLLIVMPDILNKLLLIDVQHVQLIVPLVKQQRLIV